MRPQKARSTKHPGGTWDTEACGYKQLVTYKVQTVLRMTHGRLAAVAHSVCANCHLQRCKLFKLQDHGTGVSVQTFDLSGQPP